MERYDFYRAFSKLSASELIDRMASTSKDDEYVRLISRSNNLLGGIFSYRVEVRNEFTNQFGDQEEVFYQYWCHINFYILSFEKKMSLIIENPTRNMQRFFGRVNEFADFNTSFDDLCLEDLYDWISGFKGLKVLKAKYKNIAVTGSTSATVEASSKTNAIRDVRGLNIANNAKLVKFKAEFLDSGNKVTFEVSNNSTFSIDASEGSGLDWLVDNYSHIFLTNRD